MSRRRSWRWSLDPRDPDYEDPPKDAGEDDFAEPPEPEYSDNGPYHYIPPGDH